MARLSWFMVQIERRGKAEMTLASAQASLPSS
jgi:hypothetical protein